MLSSIMHEITLFLGLVEPFLVFSVLTGRVLGGSI
jgi:hypothetical protein